MDESAPRCPFAAQRETRTGRHPLHLRRSVLNREILRPVLAQIGLTDMPDDPHVRLADSRAAVDWALPVFQPNHHRIAVTPRNPRFVRADLDGHILLAFDAPDLSARWRELIEAGASWDGPEFTPTIDLGTGTDSLPKVCFFAGPVLFGPEWRATPECTHAMGYPPSLGQGGQAV